MRDGDGESRPELSVVVLCYRAEHGAVDFVCQIESELVDAGLDYQLVLVANYDAGARDPTPAIVKEMASGNSRYKVVCEKKLGRMGWDMRSGLANADGSYVAVIDGDGQMPSSDIIPLFRLITSEQYDLVKSFRAKRYDGLYRASMSKVYNWLFHLLFQPEVRIRDVNAKPKIITRAALSQLKLHSNDWFTDAEIMIEAFRCKLRICEVSTVFYQNERRSSFVSLGTAFEFTTNLLYYRFKKRQRGG